MGVWTSPWTEGLMLEANRFWFYSLVLSVVWGGIQIRRLQQLSVEIKGDESPEEKIERLQKVSRNAAESQQLKRRLVTDVFDLFIPGDVTGWIRTSSLVVGFTSVVSTTLSMKDVWDRLE